MARDRKTRKSDIQQPTGLRDLARLVARRAARDAADPPFGICPLTGVPELERRLRLSEVCQICGVSVRTVHRWISHGILKSTKIGGTRLVERSELERLLRDGAEDTDKDK